MRDQLVVEVILESRCMVPRLDFKRSPGSFGGSAGTDVYFCAWC